MSKGSIDRRGALKLALSAAAGTVAMPFVSRTGLAAEPIKLGSLLDGTGALGLEGKRMIETTEYAVDLLNKGGGLLGRPIQLIAYDTSRRCSSTPSMPSSSRSRTRSMSSRRDHLRLAGGDPADLRALQDPVLLQHAV